MTELQQDGQFPYDDEPVQQEAAQVETEQETASLSDISPDPEPEQEENTEERKPNKLQERLDKLTAEKYEAKRRADELEAKLRAIEAQNSTQASLPDELVAPEMPEDTWDTEAMKQWQRDMIEFNKKAAAHYAKQALSSTEQEKARAMQQQQQGEIVRTFAQRAIQSGVDIEQLQQAGTALANAGMAQDLQLLILEDEAGPLITMHLAKNPELANEILSMSPAKAAVKIATQVKAEAMKAKPKVSKAPDPIPEGKPASIVERDDFDKKYKAQWL